MATARKAKMTVGEYHTARQRLGFETPPKPRLNQRLAKLPPAKTHIVREQRDAPPRVQRFIDSLIPMQSRTPVTDRRRAQEAKEREFAKNVRGGKAAPPKAPPKRSHAPTTEDKRIAASVKTMHELDAQRARKGREYIDNLGLGSPGLTRASRREYLEAENRYLIHLHRHSKEFGGLAGTDPLEGTYQGGSKNRREDRSRGVPPSDVISRAGAYAPASAATKAARARAHVPQDK